LSSRVGGGIETPRRALNSCGQMFRDPSWRTGSIGPSSTACSTRALPSPSEV